MRLFVDGLMGKRSLERVDWEWKGIARKRWMSEWNVQYQSSRPTYNFV